MEEIINKANVLIESLPYIKEFQGKTVVIKYGGSAMTDELLQQNIILDMILLKFIGINIVVVHGGGNKINEMLDRLGKETKFINGLRVTDSDTVDIVEMVLVGKVNQKIVSLFNKNGGKAVGLSGKDGGFIKARKMSFDLIDEDGSPVDMGHIGEVIEINPKIVHILAEEGYIPIISSVAPCKDGKTLNVNADTIAGEVAVALKAEKLVLMTDVAGVKDNSGELISSMSLKEYKKYRQDKVIKGGMLPKLSACKRALDSGVRKVHIIDGRVNHSLLLEIFTKKGIGTEVTK